MIKKKLDCSFKKDIKMECTFKCFSKKVLKALETVEICAETKVVIALLSKGTCVLSKGIEFIKDNFSEIFKNSETIFDSCINDTTYDFDSWKKTKKKFEGKNVLLFARIDRKPAKNQKKVFEGDFFRQDELFTFFWRLKRYGAKNIFLACISYDGKTVRLCSQGELCFEDICVPISITKT